MENNSLVLPVDSPENFEKIVPQQGFPTGKLQASDAHLWKFMTGEFDRAVCTYSLWSSPDLTHT